MSPEFPERGSSDIKESGLAPGQGTAPHGCRGWRTLEAVDAYRKLNSSGWRDTYLCDVCDKPREISRRSEENQHITEWTA